VSRASSPTEVDDAAFIHSLLAVQRFQRTGVLEVRAEGVCTLIYVQKGIPVFAEQGSLGETLGRVLVRQGALTAEQYAAVIDRMTETVFGSEQLRFGEVAVALGYLTLQQVNDALAEQVRQKLLRCMQWSAPECEFKAVTEALDEVAHYACQVEPLLLEGLREYFDKQRVRPLWEAAATRFAALTETLDAIVARFKLGTEERALLEGIDGSRTVAQVVGSGQLDSTAAAQLLSALLLVDALGAFDSSEEAEQQAQAARSLVRVPGGRMVSIARPQSASASGPPEAIAQAVVVPSAPPAAAADPGPEAPSAAAPEASEPAPPPSDPPRPVSIPVPPDVKHSRLRAEQLFQSGRKHLREGRWQKALADLDKAAKRYPEAIEYKLHAAWAEFRMLDDPERMEELKEELADLALRAVRQDKTISFAHYVHAQLFLMAGDEKAARRSFGVAWKLDRSDRDAERHYRVLDRRLRGDDKGH
jgi:tetratricopeptide (TPR) repeat protein